MGFFLLSDEATSGENEIPHGLPQVTKGEFYLPFLLILAHRGLKLDGAIGQVETCNSLKTENFSKSFLSHIGKNKIKF